MKEKMCVLTVIAFVQESYVNQCLFIVFPLIQHQMILHSFISHIHYDVFQLVSTAIMG